MTEPSDPAVLLTAILTEHGPLAEDDIAARLCDAGVADPARILRRLRLGVDVPAGQLVDGRWVWLPAVLAGRVFTRRITESEVDCDLLAVTADLAPIAVLCDYPPYQRLVDGCTIIFTDLGDDRPLDRSGRSTNALGDRAVLVLPAGIFTALGVGDGDLIGLRLTDAGLALERVTAAAASTTVLQLTELLGAQLQFVDSLVWTACHAAPEAFTEVAAPLSEQAAACGLTGGDSWLAPADFDLAHWRYERTCDRLARRHRIDLDTAAALYTLLRLHQLLAAPQLYESATAAAVAEAVDAVADEVGAALADPAFTELLALETAELDGLGADGLQSMADALEPRLPVSAQVACQWLRAVALERRGDIAGCERALLAAHATDGDWPLPLHDLARIASDRGDADTGLALLRRAGASANDPLTLLLQRYRGVRRTDLGRNQPCWCGSGRKHKKCHLDRAGLPLRDRVGWLYHKAIQHVLFGDWTELRHAVAFERCRAVFADDGDAFNAALADLLVIDTVLVEGGAFHEFLSVRGALLPEDERHLAGQWLQVQRSVFDVEQAQHHGNVTVRDARTGERHQVDVERTGHQLHRGQSVCARLLSDGVGRWFAALEPVSAPQRGPLIALLDTDPDPVELMAHLSDGTKTVYLPAL